MGLVRSRWAAEYFGEYQRGIGNSVIVHHAGLDGDPNVIVKLGNSGRFVLTPNPLEGGMARDADHLFVMEEYMKGMVAKRHGRPPEKMHVLGIPDVFCFDGYDIPHGIQENVAYENLMEYFKEHGILGNMTFRKVFREGMRRLGFLD